MAPAPRPLEEPYRGRAVPPGSARYFSWLFAAPEMREPLLGLYALSAELRALADPATEATAAQLKLAWWREEIERLARGVPAHPIGRYLAALPRADAVDFGSLYPAVEAAAHLIAGAALERTSDLLAHASAAATPLLLAAQLGREPAWAASDAVQQSVRALACAEYLAEALESYVRAARAGRVIFPVDELLAAGVEDRDLTAREPPVHLESYLEEVRVRARRSFAAAADALPRAAQAPLRHVPILAALGARHLRQRRGWRDLFLAWSTARRAARGS
jgi:15-cis-phytoene synthase